MEVERDEVGAVRHGEVLKERRDKLPVIEHVLCTGRRRTHRQPPSRCLDRFLARVRKRKLELVERRDFDPNCDRLDLGALALKHNGI